MNLSPNFSLAIEAAVEAGVAVKTVYESKKFDIEIKSDNSPVTRADKLSSEIIARYLQKTNIPVIDEEHCCAEFELRKHWKDVWLVDPMDGTKEFISGNGEFTVNIGLVEYGRPVFGVIYAPVSGLLYWGSSITGSFKTEHVFQWDDQIVLRAIKLKPEENQGNLRVAASRSHLDEHTKAFIHKLEEKFGSIEFVSKGSSLKLCMVAEGETDIYPRFSRTMEWDTAAGHAIVAGTGGVLLHSGTYEELIYNKPDISNGPFFALSGLQLQRKNVFI